MKEKYYLTGVRRTGGDATKRNGGVGRRGFLKTLSSASLLAAASGSATAQEGITPAGSSDEEDGTSDDEDGTSDDEDGTSDDEDGMDEEDLDDDAVIVTAGEGGPEAEDPDGATYSAGDVGELVNAIMADGHRSIHIEEGTYTLDTRITAQDGMTLRGHDRPTFEITWGNTALSDSGTTFDIAVYTNPDASTSDVTIDGIVFDAVEEPSNPSESQIIGDPRNVTPKYNWTIRNCEFDHLPKYAINLDNHENALVENCRFDNGSYWWVGIPLRVHTVRDTQVLDCEFGRNENGSSFPDLRLDGFDTEVRGCEFTDIYVAGIDVVDDHVTHEVSFQVSDCRFTGSGSGTGITIDHAQSADNVVEQNEFDSLDYGVNEVSGGRTRVVDNTFENIPTEYVLAGSSSALDNR